MERKYMMYEGEDTNTIDLLYEKPTSEPNGVKVIVPIKYYDRGEFKEKIREQLAYFENVYFNVDGIGNDFSIIRAEHFQWSPLASDPYLHICLDNVYYPLDFQKIGIDKKIDFPVALRFGLTDGIFPTPNREAIRYTKEAKDVILNKLKLVANYFVEKYNESVKDGDDFMQVYEYYKKDSRYLKSFGKSLDVALVKDYSSVKLVKPKLKGVDILDLKRLCESHYSWIFNEYEIKYKIERGRWKEVKRWGKEMSLNDIRDVKNKLIFSDRIGGNMKDYLKQLYPSSSWSDKTYICKKVRQYPLWGKNSNDYDNYYDILDLKKIPRKDWRQAIQEFQLIVKSLESKFINIDEIVIPQQWLDARKKMKVSISGGSGGRRIKLKGEVTGKQIQPLERDVAGKHGKQVSIIHKLEDAHKHNKLVIYGRADQASLMDKLFSAVKKEKIDLIIFSERELKNFEKINLHNWISMDKFMEGNNKPFKRIITAYLIDKLMRENRNVFEKAGQIGKISNDLYTKLKTLYDYREAHHKNGSDEIYKAMLEVAESKNLFDMEIYHVYTEMRDLLAQLPFLNTLLRHFSSYGDNTEMLKIIIDLFKYNKKRIDWQHYKITDIDAATSPEVPSEEEIEELCV